MSKSIISRTVNGNVEVQAIVKSEPAHDTAENLSFLAQGNAIYGLFGYSIAAPRDFLAQGERERAAYNEFMS